MLKNIVEFSVQIESEELSPHQAVAVMDCMLEGPPRVGHILLVSPDTTRCCSHGGVTTPYLYHRLSRGAKIRIIPAAGTYRVVSREEQTRFFRGDMSEEVFLYHGWRKDMVPVGTVPGVYYGQVPRGRYMLDIGAEVNRCVMDGSFDPILFIGQIAPHGIIGMSDYIRNIPVGPGGRPMVNGTHMLGALYNLETITGNTDTPVRAVFDYGEEHFLRDVPLVYILTVVSEQKGRTVFHGTFIGTSRQVYEHVTALAKRRCITQVERRVEKVVVYLEPEEFSTTWVRNKTTYYTRMMIENGGELLITVPGIKGFGKNPEVGGLIRRCGYKGAPYTIELMENGALPGSTMVLVHMIHSPSEDKFVIIYTVGPEYASQDEIGRIGYEFVDTKDVFARYPVPEVEDR